ncbi:MAG: division/cell wall cluster transcriptional repressor MraZ [bacterium]
MLISSHNVSIDAKGRISIPAKFREYLNATYGDQLILLDMDGCIFAYPLEEWRRRFSSKFSALPSHREEVRRYVRSMYARATQCEIDRQGRILLPARLREAARIEKEAVLVGLESKFEIWSRDLWESQLEENRDILETVPESGMIDLEF